jgi:hypothetical protein
MSQTVLLYEKGDPTLLDNYRPITLTNAIYKLWTTCIVILATDCIETRKILSPKQEGFRADSSCARAVTHLSLCVEDAHTSKRDIVMCYLDFKGAFPSADQYLLVRTLNFLGLPDDFINIITNLYHGATTEFITPHGHTPPIGIRRGTLQGDTLSPFLFTIFMEPLLRWLAVGSRGYRPSYQPHKPTASIITYDDHGYADDISITAGSILNLKIQLQKLHLFSQYTGLQLETTKCEATGALWALGNPLTHNNLDMLQAQITSIKFLDGTRIKYLPPNK